MGERQLSDFCDIIMGQSPQGSECNSSGQGVPLLNGPTEFRLINPIPVQWTVNPRKFSKCGDLLFCVRGSTTGKMNWSDQRYAIGRGLAAISPRTPSTMHFFKGLIESNLASLLAGATGSTFPNVSRPDLATIPVQVSDIDYIRSASKVLEGIERKIELNHKMNQTLEDIAKAIFKSWFVDFDPVRAKAEGRLTSLPAEISDLFPDTFVETDLGKLPAGWTSSSIDGACTKIFSGGTPSTTIPRYWDGNYGWLSSGETGAAFIISTDKTITDAGVQNSSTKEALRFDTVIASAGQGKTRGQTSLLLLDTYVNQSVVTLRARREVGALLLYFNLAQRYDEFRRHSDSSSSRGSLTTSLLKELPFVIPNQEVCAFFDKTAHSIVGKIELNLRENVVLMELRGTLLPKLISGELRIPDAEKFLEEAGI